MISLVISPLTTLSNVCWITWWCGAMIILLPMRCLKKYRAKYSPSSSHSILRANVLCSAVVFGQHLLPGALVLFLGQRGELNRPTILAGVLHAVLECTDGDMLAQQFQVTHLVRPLDLLQETAPRPLIATALEQLGKFKAAQVLAPDLGPLAHRLERHVVVHDVDEIHLVDSSQTVQHVIRIDLGAFAALGLQLRDIAQHVWLLHQLVGDLLGGALAIPGADGSVLAVQILDVLFAEPALLC